MDARKSIILIGMPGAGKSTVGVLLAKRLAREFVDVDLVIQARQGRTLQQIIAAEGLDAFVQLEGRCTESLALSGQVIATGGSVIYSESAMRRLSADGLIVHLSLPLEELRGRLGDLRQRGVVMACGQTLDELYVQRMPLYDRWAHWTLDCRALDHYRVVDAIVARLAEIDKP